MDSGTNILLLPDEAFNGIRKTFQKQCTQYNLPHVCDGSKTFFDGFCYSLSNAQLNQFPPIQLNINGVLLNMTATDYILQETTKGVYCLGIMNTGRGGLNIIGDTVLQNYYTLFDNVQYRLGWAPVNAANCFN